MSESTEDLREAITMLESRLNETQFALSQSLERSAFLNRQLRDREGQINMLTKANQAMQEQIGKPQREPADGG